jgi:acetolactate synthase-1/2/3 large subunit
MNIQELGTIMQYRPDVKILILNNSYLGMVRQWQELFHEERYSSVDIQSPDFVQVAKGYGIEGFKVTQREELKTALRKMLDHKGAFLLEVMTGKEHNVFPMIPQGKSVSEIVLSDK